RRQQISDTVLMDAQKKWPAIISEIIHYHRLGRPVLIGTRSVTMSNHLASMLQMRDLPYQLLNATRHHEENAIIARAGEAGRITIATNMAGRGTDIKLGEGINALGGLHVIATERHTSDRIDKQLFGRCGRQGNRGSVHAFIAIDDELFRRFIPLSLRLFLWHLLTRKIPGGGQLALWLLRFSQKRAQRQTYQQRLAVLRSDTKMEESLSFGSSHRSLP
ncbi:hypothetical protein ACQZV8_21140, partial [Magnetococcales bacterium HHB-1]